MRIGISKLKEENTELRNYIKKILVEGSQDNHEKQFVEQWMEAKNENEKLTDTANQLAEELNQLQKEKEVLEEKIRQLEPGRSLADEFSEVNAKVATSTQTEVEYESRGIEASDHETTVPKTQDQGTNAGVDASSSTGQKETNTVEVQTEEQVIDLYNKEGKYVRTELSDPSAVSAQALEKSTPSKG